MEFYDYRDDFIKDLMTTEFNQEKRFPVLNKTTQLMKFAIRKNILISLFKTRMDRSLNRTIIFHTIDLFDRIIDSDPLRKYQTRFLDLQNSELKLCFNQKQLSYHQFESFEYQIAIVCLVIMCKYNDKNSTITYTEIIQDYNWKSYFDPNLDLVFDIIEKHEIKVLNILDWRLSIVSTLDFLHFILLKLPKLEILKSDLYEIFWFIKFDVNLVYKFTPSTIFFTCIEYLCKERDYYFTVFIFLMQSLTNYISFFLFRIQNQY